MLMMLIAKGGLQLNGAHIHQNFRLKEDRNKKFVSVLYKVDFQPKCPAPSDKRVALLMGSSVKRKGLFFF